MGGEGGLANFGFVWSGSKAGEAPFTEIERLARR